MPYKIVKTKNGYGVIKKTTGQKVAGKNKPLTLKSAKGYIWHAENSDKKQKGRR